MFSNTQILTRICQNRIITLLRLLHTQELVHLPRDWTLVLDWVSTGTCVITCLLRRKKFSEPGKILDGTKCTKRTSHDKFGHSFYLDDKVASFITSTVSSSNAKLRQMRIDCDNQNNENITKSNFTTHLAPCLPPLLGLIKTAKGCEPRRGEICKENFVLSTNR